MGYRELSRMEIVEVIRRWQVGESQRAIARACGVARETVKKYLRAVEELGLAANGPPPTEDQVVRLVQLGRVVSSPRTWATPQADRLEPYREQITTWLQDEQTVEATIEGLEKAWAFFQGCPKRLMHDYVARHIIRLLCPTGLCGRRAVPKRESSMDT